MKSFKYCILFCASLVLLMLLSSCTATVATVGTTKTPSSLGFIQEMDEPSARGVLSLVSPSDVYVGKRFALSPNGEAIVFSGKRIDDISPSQLYMLDLSGTTLTKLTSGGEISAWYPCFTSDGNHIVYSSGKSIWKIKVGGTGARMKLTGSGLNVDYYPQLSVDGKLVFVTYRANTDQYFMWIIGIDGSELTQLREGNVPVWSPDGKLIAFQYKGDIWMMGSDGSLLTQLTNTANISEDLPCFSPDGTHIVFVSNAGKSAGTIGDANIWTIKTDGTELTQITELGSWESWPLWGQDGIYFLSGRAKRDKDIIRIWKIKIDREHN